MRNAMTVQGLEEVIGDDWAFGPATKARQVVVRGTVCSAAVIFLVRNVWPRGPMWSLDLFVVLPTVLMASYFVMLRYHGGLTAIGRFREVMLNDSKYSRFGDQGAYATGLLGRLLRRIIIPREARISSAGIAGTAVGIAAVVNLELSPGSTQSQISAVLEPFLAASAGVSVALLIALVVSSSVRFPMTEGRESVHLGGVYMIVYGLGVNLLAILPWRGSIDWMSAVLLPPVTGCVTASLAVFLIMIPHVGIPVSEPESEAAADSQRSSEGSGELWGE